MFDEDIINADKAIKSLVSISKDKEIINDIIAMARPQKSDKFIKSIIPHINDKQVLTQISNSYRKDNVKLIATDRIREVELLTQDNFITKNANFAYATMALVLTIAQFMGLRKGAKLESFNDVSNNIILDKIPEKEEPKLIEEFQQNYVNSPPFQYLATTISKEVEGSDKKEWSKEDIEKYTNLLKSIEVVEQVKSTSRKLTQEDLNKEITKPKYIKNKSQGRY
jgi:hypothetical protein